LADQPQIWDEGSREIWNGCKSCGRLRSRCAAWITFSPVLRFFGDELRIVRFRVRAVLAIITTEGSVAKFD
jgi:hypothetical protein